MTPTACYITTVDGREWYVRYAAEDAQKDLFSGAAHIRGFELCGASGSKVFIARDHVVSIRDAA